MRTQIVEELELRLKRLKSQKKFYESISLKCIPAFQALIEAFINAIQDNLNQASIDLEGKIRELEEVINDLCGINGK